MEDVVRNIKMKLEKLTLKNFKSIKNAEISLTNKSIIIGANASGKSNLISALKFINYILLYGIDDAVSLLGGFDNLINLNSLKNETIDINFSFLLENDNWYRSFNKSYIIRPSKLGYNLSLGRKGNNQFKVISDEMIITFALGESKNKKKFLKDNDTQLGAFTIKFAKNGRTVKSDIIENNTPLTDREIENERSINFYKIIIKEDKKELILNSIRYFLPPIYINNNELFKIYDFDPKLLKTPSQITSKHNLEEDGANIGVVLERLLRDKTNKKTLLNLLTTSLPNINRIEIKKNIDKSVAYQMIEKFSNKPLYSQFLSDGTVSMLALVIALYFNEDENIIILEEPERNLHPQVIRKLVEMINEVSRDKQIIITTHNSEIIKNSSLDELICMRRNNNGESQIYRPQDKPMILSFLKNDLGLDDLFLDGIL